MNNYYYHTNSGLHIYAVGDDDGDDDEDEDEDEDECYISLWIFIR